MHISDIVILEGNKYHTCINVKHKDPKFSNPQFLNLRFTLLDVDLTENSELTGQVEFVHLFPNVKKRTRRCWFDRSQLSKDLSYSITICTGDLLERIRITLYYDLPEVGLMEIILTEAHPPNATKTVKEVLLPEYPLEFLDTIRSLNREIFLTWVERELHALEATSTKGSMETFKKWVICDRIIHLWATNEVPAKRLHWAIQNFGNEYFDYRKALGITDE